jgi:hypothetical protein
MARLKLVATGPQVDERTALLVAEISEVLAYLGGAAHRDTVLSAVIAIRRGRQDRLAHDIADEIEAVFLQGVGEDDEDPRPFRLPFGPGSRRWALRNAPPSKPRPLWPIGA